MLYVASEEFFCQEHQRFVRPGESVELSRDEARQYAGMVRATTMGSATRRRAAPKRRVS